jgi:hypothetical protein
LIGLSQLKAGDIVKKYDEKVPINQENNNLNQNHNHNLKLNQNQKQHKNNKNHHQNIRITNNNKYNKWVKILYNKITNLHKLMMI